LTAEHAFETDSRATRHLGANCRATDHRVDRVLQLRTSLRTSTVIFRVRSPFATAV
jgi:hypothetical protein